MSKIGENRLAIYNLFYEHPLCDYIHNNSLNILILGNGWVGNEAFKAVFWCGFTIMSIFMCPYSKKCIKSG